MLASIADLLGWPQVAEASSGVPGCLVTATTGGQTATTDANGVAILSGITFPNVITVTGCTGGGVPATFNVSGAAGAQVKVEVELDGVEVKVKNHHVSQPKVSEPSVSEPSEPSPPSQPSNQNT
jgi:hypothetical protein